MAVESFEPLKMDLSDEATPEKTEDSLKAENLPDCRNKRSYICGYCNLKTLNPREYLYHMRDKHGQAMKIYECNLCTYASKSVQKLIRHNDMVHKIKTREQLLGEAACRKTTPVKDKPPKVSSKKSPPTTTNSRSPRESKSPRRFEEYEFTDELDFDFEDSCDSLKQNGANSQAKQLYTCDQCDFSSVSAKMLGAHENQDHSKQKFYKCSRCNYATHMKGRYSKHMKYHDLPIIKCEWCDFSSPYKWNLDRHNKNHTDESAGEYQCHLCNFKAQIKQSLTVHVLNHHLTDEQFKEKEAKRTYGIKDFDDYSNLTEEELEMLRMERDEDLEALEIPPPELEAAQSFTISNFDLDGQDEEGDVSLNGNDEGESDGEPKKKKPKIKITLKKMKNSKDTFFQEMNERHNFEEDFIHPDDVAHRNGNVYIKTEKCTECSFKAPFANELHRHMKKVHGIHSKSSDDSKKTKKYKKTNSSKPSTPEGDQINGNINDLHDQSDEDNSNDTDINEDINSNPDGYIEQNNKQTSTDKKVPSTKKKPSFFDKLQEKLSLSNVQNLVCHFCGHNSKCLSESVRHQKLHLSAKNIYASASLSTRCQFCRHRCKTTDDLVNHLKSCPEARKNLIGDDDNENSREGGRKRKHSSSPVDDEEDAESNASSSQSKQHPMENRVFVWNNFGANENEEGEEGIDAEHNVSAHSESPSENSLSMQDVDEDDEDDAEYDVSIPTTKKIAKKVYKCPDCKFWSTTASRFHVHIVGHFNKKPYSCSFCGYRSNWRWDITKHIKLKGTKEGNHIGAEIKIVDTVGEKNYEKYDKYVKIVQLDTMNKSRTEGGLAPSRRGRPPTVKKVVDKESDMDATNSPCTTPTSLDTDTIDDPSGNAADSLKIPAPPKLTRAPNRIKPTTSAENSPGLFTPIIPGDQPMIDMGTRAGENDSPKLPMRPPPLMAMGAMAHAQEQALANVNSATASPVFSEDKDSSTLTENSLFKALSANYQIITSQGSLPTSLSALQILASGGADLSLLKKPGAEGVATDRNQGIAADQRDQAPTDQMQNQETGSTSSDGANNMQMVLDHEGNPEWKCSICDFRDNEQDTVSHHLRLAHSKKGPVSLVHAVHRCSVCGFAAGTKRHVQVHLESAHNGQGGIISRSEGQNVETDNSQEEPRSFDCRMCPFTCKKRVELKAHLSHHTPRADYVFKCMICPYYVANKNDLFSHLSVHGMDVNNKAQSGENQVPQAQVTSPPPQMDGNRQFNCGMCPFESTSRAKLMHHRQFHRPRGLPFACPHCSYNVTRRHLLAQHLRTHGVSPTEMDTEPQEPGSKGVLQKYFEDHARSKSPSPSLTITPIMAENEAHSSAPKIDPLRLPILPEGLTKNLGEIPLVWVSRDSKFFKMFKCRHCPHVNLRKNNIQEHEKMHQVGDLPPGTGHTCKFCTYTCINAGVMTHHMKVHFGNPNKCHAIVDPALPNEQQLFMLAGAGTPPPVTSSPFLKPAVKQCDEKLLYYCQHCPARFFREKEVQIHSRSHTSNPNFIHHCDKCNFRGREESQLISHRKVHTPEYQEHTRTLMSMHRSAPSCPFLVGVSLPGTEREKSADCGMGNGHVDGSKIGMVNGISRPWMTSPQPMQCSAPPQPPPTSRFKCDQCPTTFGKLLTLQYHQSLHSANNPHKCNRCTYAAKTQDGLQSHILLHEKDDLEKESVSPFIAPTPPPPAPVRSPSPILSPKRLIENTLGVLSATNLQRGLSSALQDSLEHPPIKLKFIGLKGESNAESGKSKKQFKYYIEEQVPLSGVELLKRKNAIEREMPREEGLDPNGSPVKKAKDDRTGNSLLHYPLHIDKNTGKTRDKKFRCTMCPSAFEKGDQFSVHINLHGSNYKYKCRMCDYSVRFYANFTMHSRRHKYHDKIDAQMRGLAPPPENMPKYEPLINENAIVEEKEKKTEVATDCNNKENLYQITDDMTTSEKQQVILHNKKPDSFKVKEDAKDVKIFYCQYCPYSSQRRDAVDSHSLRHQANHGRGTYQCNFCDYTASQPNFIREHTKVHFKTFKYVVPEGFMKHDKLEIWSIKSGEIDDNDDTPKKCLAFGHDEGVYVPDANETKKEEVDEKPCIEKEEPKEEDSQTECGILVDLRSGDVIEAPANFVITNKPSKRGSGSMSNGKSSRGRKPKKQIAPQPIPNLEYEQMEEEQASTFPVSDVKDEDPKDEDAMDTTPAVNGEVFNQQESVTTEEAEMVDLNPKAEEVDQCNGEEYVENSDSHADCNGDIMMENEHSEIEGVPSLNFIPISTAITN